MSTTEQDKDKKSLKKNADDDTNADEQMIELTLVFFLNNNKKS